MKKYTPIGRKIFSYPRHWRGRKSVDLRAVIRRNNGTINSNNNVNLII